MKRTGNLWQEITSIENIKMAFIESVKQPSKRKRKDVKERISNLDKNAEWLKNNFHISGKYIHKTIVDQNSNKERQLEIPRYFPDQVIHHAITRVTLPYIMKKIPSECCCSIKGRGTLYASKLLRKAVKKKGMKYYAQFDIKKYFPSIDQDILMAQLERIFKDENLLEAYREIIYSIPNGLSIGNYTSQSLSNLYLTPLDRFVKQKLRIEYYVRYADDFVLVSSNKRKLEKAIPQIVEFLKRELHLELHSPIIVRKIEDKPIDFCGYKHYKSHTALRKRNWKKTRRMLLRQVTKSRALRLMSYLGYLVNSNSRNIINRFSNILSYSKLILRKGAVIYDLPIMQN